MQAEVGYLSLCQATSYPGWCSYKGLVPEGPSGPSRGLTIQMALWASFPHCNALFGPEPPAPAGRKHLVRFHSNLCSAIALLWNPGQHLISLSLCFLILKVRMMTSLPVHEGVCWDSLSQW